ncbi:hypothetical protein E4T91_11860, partial [Ligilactobacillus murinus]
STSSSKISPNNKNKKKTIRIFQNFQKIRMVFFKDRDLCHSLFYLLSGSQLSRKIFAFNSSAVKLALSSKPLNG